MYITAKQQHCCCHSIFLKVWHGEESIYDYKTSFRLVFATNFEIEILKFINTAQTRRNDKLAIFTIPYYVIDAWNFYWLWKTIILKPFPERET